jgi:DNA-binding CsgD family transcriptional regulator
MKLKSPPLPGELPPGLPTSTPVRTAKATPAASALRIDHKPLDPLAALVRRLASQPMAEAPSGTSCNGVNGTVVAETVLEGTRYVLVRCAPKPEELLSLSPRERDIVDLITKGYPNKAIAELLDISAWTVGTHLRRIFAKLGVTSRAAMVARYLHHVSDGPGPTRRGR